jgi:hypothetical protein
MKKIILFSFSICLLIIANSCSKDSNPSNSDDPNTQNPYVQNPDVAENIVLITDSNSQVVSSESDLANGVYKINFTGSVPNIVATDIIIGDAREGFLRKVTSVSANGNTLTMQTTQANMEDVFKNATIEFTTDITETTKSSNIKSQHISINYVAKGVTISGNGLEYNFSNTVLYENGPLTFKITNGTATFDPNFYFKSDYSIFRGLEFLEFKAENAILDIDCDISLNASAGISLPTFEKKLADYDTPLTFLVAGLPVKIVVNTKLVAALNASITSNVHVTTGFKNNYILSTNVKYEKDYWSGNFEVFPTLTPKPVNFSGEVNIAQNLTITPRVSVKFYGVIGPFCEPKMTEDFTFNIASPSLDRDANLKVGLDIKTGIEITIFGYNKEGFANTNSFEEIIWNSPDKIEIISGNNQTGTSGQLLTDPLKVKVADNLGNPLSFVPVYFDVNEGVGSGTVDNTSIITDADGYAEVLLTLGTAEGNQIVNVSARRADGSPITSSVYFLASSSGSNDPNDPNNPGPQNLQIISGNNQTGPAGQLLGTPIKVRATDDLGNPLSNVAVSFYVDPDEGTLSSTSDVTDANGFAEVQLTLGGVVGPHVVHIIAYNNQLHLSASFTVESASVNNNFMTITVTNLLGACDDCDLPGISWSPYGYYEVRLGYGESSNFRVSIDDPNLYLWTCSSDCIWQAYSVPIIVGASIDTDEYNPNHRKLRFTRVD